MVGVIESWSDEVVHTRVDYGELLFLSFLDVEDSCDERAALSDDATREREVDPWGVAEFEVLGEGLEIGFEVGDGALVGCS